MAHGLLDTEGEGSKEKGIDDCCESLVQKSLDHNVAHFQRRLLERPFRLGRGTLFPLFRWFAIGGEQELKIGLPAGRFFF